MDARLHYTDSGSGLPILCLHGNPGTHRDFARLQAELGDRLPGRLVCLDRPGHGKSVSLPNRQAGEYTATRRLSRFVLDVCGGSALLVGYSMGCYHALRLAVSQPEKVRALLLVAPFIAARPEDKASGVPDRCATPLIGPLLRVLLPALARKTIQAHVRRVLSPQVPDAQQEAQLLTEYLQADTLVATMNDKNQIVQEPLDEEKLKQIACPVHIVQGDRDAINPGHAARLQTLLPAATLRQVEGSGHAVLFTRADVVAEELRSLVGKL